MGHKVVVAGHKVELDIEEGRKVELRVVIELRPLRNSGKRQRFLRLISHILDKMASIAPDYYSKYLLIKGYYSSEKKTECLETRFLTTISY